MFRRRRKHSVCLWTETKIKPPQVTHQVDRGVKIPYNIVSKIKKKSYFYGKEVLKHKKDNHIVSMAFPGATRLRLLSTGARRKGFTQIRVGCISKKKREGI